MTSTPSRDVATRKKDVLKVLASQGHYWLCTGDIRGRPHMIGVSAIWSDDELLVTTLGTSRTARNMEMNHDVVLAHGDPGDAIVVQAGVIESSPVADSPQLLATWKKVMGWDPSELGDWTFFRLRPTRIQAFRGYEEIEGRDVMVRSRWLA